MKNDDIEKLREELMAALPPVFGRNAVDRLLPGVITSKYLGNLAWVGEGPAFHKIGGRVVYGRDSFIDWLLSRV